MLRFLILFSFPLLAQFGVKYWKPVGVGNTAARPATCTASKDAYVNTQTSTIDYCVAGTWTALASGGSGTVTSVDATGGVETDSGSPITASGTVRGGIVVNAQTGTSYTILTGDRGKLVTHTNGSAIAVTLPQAGGTFPANWYYMVQNRGAGTVTITPTTSTIDGAASLALLTGQGAIIVSDGINYFTMRGLGTATGLGDPGSNSIVYRNGAGTSAPATATEMAGPLYCADAGANDTYACTLSPAPSAYTTGATYIFRANTANTGAATINFNSLGAKTIKKVAGGITTDLADNDIRSWQVVTLTYDGTNMQMQSLLGNAASGAGNVSTSATLTANLPVLGNGTTDVIVGTRSGNTTAYVTTTGAQTSGDCVKIDANGNHVANGSACGSGGGSSITYGAYGSLPGTCTTGDLYRTSDSLYEFQCTASNTWTSFVDGRRTKVPSSASWTWDNQGSSTVDATFGSINFTFLSAGATQMRAYYRTAPSAPYTVKMFVDRSFYSHAGTNNTSRSLAWGFRDGTGKLVVCQIVESGIVDIEYWTNSTTYSSQPYTSGSISSIANWNYRPRLWVAMRDDNTDIKFFVSMTGVGVPGTSGDWVQIGSSLGRTAHLGSGPTQYWIGSYVSNGDTVMSMLSLEEI